MNQGKQHGQGTLTTTDGWAYIGPFHNGEKHGQGKESFSDGREYVGQYHNGKRRGQGNFTWPDGWKYIGQWANGKRHGHGKEIHSDGREYVGQFHDGKRHGQGIQKAADGRTLKSVITNILAIFLAKFGFSATELASRSLSILNLCTLEMFDEIRRSQVNICLIFFVFKVSIIKDKLMKPKCFVLGWKLR